MLRSEVGEDLETSWGVHQGKLKHDIHNLMIDDTIRDMEGWACFEQEKPRKIRPFSSVREPPEEAVSADEDRAKRPVSMRKWKEIQEMLRCASENGSGFVEKKFKNPEEGFFIRI